MKNKKLIKILAIIITVIIVLAITYVNLKTTSTNLKGVESYQITSDEMYYNEDSSSNEEYSEKIIYTSTIDLEVKDAVTTVEEIINQTKEMGGYVSYSSINQEESYKVASIEVRIPTDLMEDFIAETEGLGNITNKITSSDNITETYYDTKTRLEYKEAEANTLIDLFDRAESVEDVLLIQSELSIVQEQIEIYKAQLERWDILTDFSTITINIEEETSLDNVNDIVRFITPGETGRAIVRGVKNSVIFLANGISFIIRIVATLFIPVLIIGSVTLIIIKKIKNKKINK